MLSELIQEACKYGKINLYQSRDTKRFHFSIEFYTDKGIELEARSHFSHLTPESAVVEAIQKAIQITKTFQSSNINTKTSETLLLRVKK